LGVSGGEPDKSADPCLHSSPSEPAPTPPLSSSTATAAASE
jgi:hypothetical protein